jgi:hypothetical protein
VFSIEWKFDVFECIVGVGIGVGAGVGVGVGVSVRVGVRVGSTSVAYLIQATFGSGYCTGSWFTHCHGYVLVYI